MGRKKEGGEKRRGLSLLRAFLKETNTGFLLAPFLGSWKRKGIPTAERTGLPASEMRFSQPNPCADGTEAAVHDLGRKWLSPRHPGNQIHSSGLSDWPGRGKAGWWLTPVPQGRAWLDPELGSSGSLGPCLGTCTGQGVCLCSLKPQPLTEGTWVGAYSMEPGRARSPLPERLLIGGLVQEAAGFVFSCKSYNQKSGWGLEPVTVHDSLLRGSCVQGGRGGVLGCICSPGKKSQ